MTSLSLEDILSPPRVEMTAVNEGGVRAVPINRMVPRTFTTNIKSGEMIQPTAPTLARGITFGSDIEVARLELSTDGGKVWTAAKARTG
jgi:hypothetical protein